MIDTKDLRDKKKILIVSASFYPENSPRSFRTTELAKEFARIGHVVTVITPCSEDVHNKFESDFNISIKNLGFSRLKMLEIKGGKFEKIVRRVLIRISRLLFEFPYIQLLPLVKRALKSESNYDLLISIAMPHPVHWGVASIRSLKHPIAKVWVADCGDPYMGHENDTFRPPFYFKYVEKWFCRRADYISVPTKGAVSAYYPEFHKKIKIISQGFKFEDVKVKVKANNKSYPEFGYAGMFIQGRRDPTKFLSYLANFQMDYRFHIYTKTPALVIPFVIKSDGRIVLHQPIPREKLMYELSGMDFMVNFENKGSKQTPSKLIDYAIINKPILAIKTGSLKPEIINEFLTGTYTNQFTVEREQYRIEKVVKKFLALV